MSFGPEPLQRFRTFLLLAALSFAGFHCHYLSAAPAQTVKVIVPFAPGGGSDTLARVLVRSIENDARTEQSWIVINVPGAGGSIGSRRARRAAPDGSTLLFLHDAILTARLSQLTPFGPDSFEPVAATGSVKMVLCVHEDSSHNSLLELLTSAAEAPDTITVATNLGAPSYYLVKLLEQQERKPEFRLVQSGGGAKRFADLVGRHVDVTVFSLSEYLAFKDGGIRALALFSETRDAKSPDVPTATESGIEISYENLQAWWVPSKTPKEVIGNRKETLERAMSDPKVEETLREMSIDPVFLGPGDLGSVMGEKEQSLSSIPPPENSFQSPRFEILLLLLLGISIGGLLFVPARSRNAVKSAQGSVSSPEQVILVGMTVVYVGLFSFQPVPHSFLTTSILFLVGVSIIVHRGHPRWHLVPAFAVPLLLQLSLEQILGIDLP